MCKRSRYKRLISWICHRGSKQEVFEWCHQYYLLQLPVVCATGDGGEGELRQAQVGRGSLLDVPLLLSHMPNQSLCRLLYKTQIHRSLERRHTTVDCLILT
jgi:hypothetical protein